MPKYTSKLGTDQCYQRPKKTLQEQLTPDEIKKKLEGYEKVEDIAEVPIGTHLRYFAIQPDGSKVFRLGGLLQTKTDPEKFVYLSNGKNSWPVQVPNAIFFRKQTQKEQMETLRISYEKKLAEKDRTIKKLKDYIKQMNGMKNSGSKTSRSSKK
jgi:hypothetical protein